LLAKHHDADIVREMMGFNTQRLMELDVESGGGQGGTRAGVAYPEPAAPISSHRAAVLNWRQ
jgi:hypothetical protein